MDEALGEEDDEIRKALCRIHFDRAMASPTYKIFGERLPPNDINSNHINFGIILGLLPEGILIFKNIFGRLFLRLDFSNFKEEFVTFCEMYKKRLNKLGLPIEGINSTRLAALLKAELGIVLSTFGLIDDETASKNKERYQERTVEVDLSSFKSSVRFGPASATCTEISALVHQFLTLMGVESYMISFGVLNVYDGGEMVNDPDEMHNFIIINPGPEKLAKPSSGILLDPANYQRQPDPETGATSFFPRFAILPNDILSRAFFGGCCGIIKDGRRDFEYWGP
ncbi:MAG: hypothetical protein QHH09_02665 [Microgenomates group bacterium]|nr:hypothetical protein [Microgenomates group bacterium]